MPSVMENSVLGGRYRIEQKLGQGGQGTTWLAVDSKSGAKVVVKELLLSQAEDWKSVELFEREGAVLRAISHPGVPKYIDAMHVEDEGKSRFLIVQEFVRGKDLQRRLDEGGRLDEEALREFLREMGEILVYLHGLSPVVIHRDVKPSNIISRSAGIQHDYVGYSLIDFGAVLAIQPDDVGGTTVVGTSGYMPAEQLMGRAGPGSDLYALAATAVHLATGVYPSELPVDRMRIQYRDRVSFSDELIGLLDAMLEPSIGLRLSSAREMLAVLDGQPGAVDGRMARLQTESDRAVAVSKKASQNSDFPSLRQILVADKPLLARLNDVVTWAVTGAFMVIFVGGASVVTLVITTVAITAFVSGVTGAGGALDSGLLMMMGMVLFLMIGIWAYVWRLIQRYRS